MLRLLPVLTLCLLAACAGGLRERAPDPQPEPEPEPTVVVTPRDAQEDAPVPDAPLGPRCEKVCLRILHVFAGVESEVREPDWLSRCTSTCVEEASPGQLSCYERVVRPDDLDACVVD